MKNSNAKRIIFPIFKAAISVVILSWVIRKGEFNAQNIALGLSNKVLALAFFALTFLQMLASAYRTRLLMQYNPDRKMPMREMVLITWASNFISGIAPSSLFGEFFRIKMLMASADDIKKDNTIYSSMFAKVFSVFSLVLIASVALLGSSRTYPYLSFLPAIIFSVSAVALLLLWRSDAVLSSLQPSYDWFYARVSKEFLRRRLDRFKLYLSQLLSMKSEFFKIFMLSLASQVLNCISFFAVIYAIHPNSGVHAVELFCLVPIGILAMTLPISFSGLGVGHVAFSSLLAMENLSNGSDVFSVYFLFSLVFNLTGAIPLILLQRRSASTGAGLADRP